MGEETSRLPPMRLMNFITEEQLDQSKKERGERVEDGTASRDRPLFEILKENKDKRDAEFNERFKHRPPKALDEDETEFLDKLETSKRNYEKQMEEEEAQQIRDFQAAVAAHSTTVRELNEKPPVPPKVQEEQKKAVKKNPHPYNLIIKVKPHAKKAKVDPTNSEGSEIPKTLTNDTNKASDLEKKSGVNVDEAHDRPVNCLVSYSDESEDDD